MSGRGVRRAAWSVTAVVVVLLAAMTAVPAAATATCGFADGSVTVTLPADGDTARLVVGTGADEGMILFGVGEATAVRCGTAAVTTTDTVVVSGDDGTQEFRISLAGGPFAPGATAEPDGSSEIEFAVDLGGGEDDNLTIAGGVAGDHLVVGVDGVNLNAGEAADDVDVTVAGAERLNVEGNADNDLLSGAGGEGTGGAFVDGRLALRGGAGDDSLTGGPGNDILNGGLGADHLDGGPGVDTASFFGAPAGVSVSLDAGTTSGGDGADTLVGLENVTGSAFADTLIGDEGDNVLTGLEGDDTIDGLGGIDAAGYLLAESAVTVDLEAGTSSGGHGADALTGVENVLGSNFGDSLVGDGGANQIIGGPGVDAIRGGGGNDHLLGGDGDDRLLGGAGNDGIAGQAGNDTMRGGSGNDTMRGGGGDDVLFGGPGNDALRGGPAEDTCSGGPGTNQVHSCEA